MDLDSEFEGTWRGPLVSAPQFDCFKHGKDECPIDFRAECPGLCQSAGNPRCRLVLPKKRSGKGEVNEKPYWVQIMVFGELAKQVRDVPVGSIMVIPCGFNVNSWMANDNQTVKTSANYIARRIGIVEGLAGEIKWLPGAPKKAKAAKGGSHGHAESEVEETGEPSDVEVEKFLHGQVATSEPGKDAAAAGPGAEVQGTMTGVGGVPGGDGHKL